MRLAERPVRVPVPGWRSTAEPANARGLVAVVPSPGSGQMGLLEGLTREISTLCIPSHRSAIRASWGRSLGCGFPSLVPAPPVQLAVSFGLLQPRAIYLDLNNKKHIVKAGSVLTVKHSHIITTAQQQ